MADNGIYVGGKQGLCVADNGIYVSGKQGLCVGVAVGLWVWKAGIVCGCGSGFMGVERKNNYYLW